MTAGSFSFARNSIERGKTLLIRVNLLPGFGNKVYWKVSEDSDPGLIKGKTSGIIKLAGGKSTVLRIKISKRSTSLSGAVGIKMSTDKDFANPTVSLNSGFTPTYFKIVPTSKKDLITGVWSDADQPRYEGDLQDTLALHVERGNSRFGRYFLRMNFKEVNIDGNVAVIRGGSIYGDKNLNGILDKKDKLLQKLEAINSPIYPTSIPSFKEGRWLISGRDETLTIFRAGRVNYEASIDFSLF